MNKELLIKLKQKFEDRARRYNMAEYNSMQDMAMAHTLSCLYEELAEDIQEILDGDY